MTAAVHKVADGRRAKHTELVEVLKPRPDAPLEYAERHVCDVLVVPLEPGRVVVGAGVMLGPRHMPYHLADWPFDATKRAYLHAYVDQEEQTVTFFPYPPVPEAHVYVEYADAG